jgi:hypothetical protein
VRGGRVRWVAGTMAVDVRLVWDRPWSRALIDGIAAAAVGSQIRKLEAAREAASGMKG